MIQQLYKVNMLLSKNILRGISLGILSIFVADQLKLLSMNMLRKNQRFLNRVWSGLIKPNRVIFSAIMPVT
jgi:hypothetical protein